MSERRPRIREQPPCARSARVNKNRSRGQKTVHAPFDQLVNGHTRMLQRLVIGIVDMIKKALGQLTITKLAPSINEIIRPTQAVPVNSLICWFPHLSQAIAGLEVPCLPKVNKVYNAAAHCVQRTKRTCIVGRLSGPPTSDTDLAQLFYA